MTNEPCGCNLDHPASECDNPIVYPKVLEQDRWTIDCPWCGLEHVHGAQPGRRIAHCQGHRGYTLVKLRPLRPRPAIGRLHEQASW